MCNELAHTPPQWPLGMWFHQKVILSIMKLTYRPLSILQCSIIRFWSLWLNVFSETISVRDYTILQDLWEFSSLSFSMALSLLPGLRNVDYFLLRRRNACLDWLSESYWMCSAVCEPWEAHRSGELLNINTEHVDYHCLQGRLVWTNYISHHYCITQISSLHHLPLCQQQTFLYLLGMQSWSRMSLKRWEKE